MPIYNTKLLANNNLLRYFFKKNLFFLNNISNFDFFWFLSKIYKSFTNFFWMNYIFSSSRSLIFFTHFNSLFQKWILFYSNENDKLEKFSNVYLKSIQTYKNINMLMSQSLSQQLDVYVNINLINMLFKFLIKRGKKLSAWKVFIKFIRQFKNKYKMPALAIFTHAVLKLEPKIWLKKKKIAGWIYEIPIFISSRRSKAIAIRWLLEYAKKRQKYNFADSLSQEIWDACFNRGSSFNAKAVVHSTAKRNKSYMRWF
jgi:small subunit ribosomal protein S7